MTKTIRQLMTENVATVSPNSSVQEAAELMSKYNVGVIPVVDGGQIRGIITDRDITLRTTAEGMDGSTPVSQVMTADIVQGNPDMSVHEAATIMAEKQIRRLPIVENSNLVGIVALGDLAVNTSFDNEAEQALSSISTPAEPQH